MEMTVLLGRRGREEVEYGDEPTEPDEVGPNTPMVEAKLWISAVLSRSPWGRRWTKRVVEDACGRHLLGRRRSR